jgi:hypothetical protein
MRELLGRAATRRHDERLVAAAALTDEGDLRAIWRKLGLSVFCLVPGQLPRSATGDRHRPDVIAP